MLVTLMGGIKIFKRERPNGTCLQAFGQSLLAMVVGLIIFVALVAWPISLPIYCSRYWINYKAIGRGILAPWRWVVSCWKAVVVWVPRKMRDVGRGVVDGWERVRDKERNRIPVMVGNARQDRKADASVVDNLETEETSR